MAFRERPKTNMGVPLKVKRVRGQNGRGPKTSNCEVNNMLNRVLEGHKIRRCERRRQTEDGEVATKNLGATRRQNLAMIGPHAISIEDPRLDPYRNLKQSNLTRWSGLFIAEGEKVVERLLASPFEAASVLVDESRLDVLDRLKVAEGTTVLMLPHDECRQLTGFEFHQGVLACGVRPRQVELHESVPAEGRVTVVVAPRITNPDNLGTLLRLSAAFGVDAVVLGHGSADPFCRRALRVSMGAALAVPVVELREETSIVHALKKLGLAVVATVLDPEAVPLHSASRPERLALLFGNEAHGLPADIIKASDGCVTIPMSASADSLNVSAAAAIVLYHFTRVAETGASFSKAPSEIP